MPGLLFPHPSLSCLLRPMEWVKTLDFSDDLLFLSIISMLSHLPVVQSHVLQILIEQRNSGSLANGANYRPPRALPRTEVWASILWVQHTSLHALKWVRAAPPPPTHLMSLVCSVLQRKLTHFQCLGVCASSSGTLFCLKASRWADVRFPLQCSVWWARRVC